MTKFEYDMYKEYDKKTSMAAKGGMNFLEALMLVFIILKLCKIITWSWWWVLSPIWIPLGLGTHCLHLLAGSHGGLCSSSQASNESTVSCSRYGTASRTLRFVHLPVSARSNRCRVTLVARRQFL